MRLVSFTKYDGQGKQNNKKTAEVSFQEESVIADSDLLG